MPPPMRATGIDSGLEDALIAAAQVRLVVADSEREHLIPLGTIARVATGSAWIRDRRPGIGSIGGRSAGMNMRSTGEQSGG